MCDVTGVTCLLVDVVTRGGGRGKGCGAGPHGVRPVVQRAPMLLLPLPFYLLLGDTGGDSEKQGGIRVQPSASRPLLGMAKTDPVPEF